MSPRRNLRPLTGVSYGSPAAGDLRALAAILIRLDRRDPPGKPSQATALADRKAQKQDR